VSTVSIDTIQWAAKLASDRGSSLVDCGVAGSSRSLEHGQMVAMVGGDGTAVASVSEILEVFASPIVATGPSGSGMAAKLVRNMMLYGAWYMAWEGARLAAAYGIDLASLVEITDASDRGSGGMTALLARGMGADVADADDVAAVDLRRSTALFVDKDLDAALALASRLEVELPGATLVRAHGEAMVGLPPASS
jgi:3-hydroxyisobutyrate dehydrogenase